MASSWVAGTGPQRPRTKVSGGRRGFGQPRRRAQRSRAARAGAGAAKRRASMRLVSRRWQTGPPGRRGLRLVLGHFEAHALHAGGGLLPAFDALGGDTRAQDVGLEAGEVLVDLVGD